jgi:hypothetical protein
MSSGSWYTPGMYTAQNRDAAYTLAKMSEFGARPAGDPRPFPIQANPVTRTGQNRVWVSQPFYAQGQWNPTGWYSPKGGRRSSTKRSRSTKRKTKRKGTTRKGTARKGTTRKA